MNKLAIVGFAPETRELAPWNDPTYDIWVLNEAPLMDWCKRWNALFQMHVPGLYSGANTKHPDYWTWLQEQHNHPIYMQDVDPRVPDSVKYPLDEVSNLGGVRFFGQTICYVLALAVLHCYQTIEVWGVELSFTEYQYGAASWRYWVGFARAKLGAENVILHSGTKLFEGLLYGYEGAFGFGVNFFENRATELEKAWMESEDNLRRIRREMKQHIERNQYQSFADKLFSLEDTAQHAGQLAGAHAEAKKYSGFGNRQSDRGEFERAAAAANRDGEDKRIAYENQHGIVEYVWNLWSTTRAHQWGSELWRLTQELASKAYDTGAHHGHFTENANYIERYDGTASALGVSIETAVARTPEQVIA